MARRYPRAELAREAVRRFGHLGNRTIARHLVENYGEAFNFDLEVARSVVRGVVGKNGDRKREQYLPDTFRDTPVGLPVTWARPRHDYVLSNGLWGVLSDVHVPFHEPLAVETAVQWFQSESVDGLLLNGDVFDYAGVGFWPQARREFDKELELAIDFLDFLRSAFPGKAVVFKPGNHEYRLPRYFVSKAPELATSPLSAMTTVLDFEGRGIEWLMYKQKVRAGGLTIIHGDEIPIATTVNPARGLFLKAKVPALCGHCHRTSEHSERDLSGAVVTTWSVGCLCNLSPDYAPYGNWNWGAALVHVTDSKDVVGGYEVENRRITPTGRLK